MAEVLARGIGVLSRDRWAMREGIMHLTGSLPGNRAPYNRGQQSNRKVPRPAQAKPVPRTP
jgi:hypothetical protein